MHIIRVSPEEYAKLVPDRRVFFNEPSFCELNKDKVDEVHYLIVMKETSPRFGLILGQKGNLAKCPFSAPYSYPVEIRTGESIASFDEAVDAIEDYCRQHGIGEIKFVFPPLLYDEHLLTGWISAFYRRQYEVVNLDLNFSAHLVEENFREGKFFNKKARNHLSKAVRSGMKLIHCETPEEIKRAYDVVLENHTAKNRPTHLSFEQLMATMALVRHWVFLAELEGKGIGAMIFYQVRPGIVQSIYSGYLLEYSNSGVMNFLVHHASTYFCEHSFEYLDRATATEDSIPNYGLCDFKDSVGCKRSLKYSFRKAL